MAKAAKKQTLDEATENEVQTRLSAVKKAKSLDELLAALQALPHGEAGNHALRRLQLPLRNFGGARPEESDCAISWDPARLLVVEESLDDARIVPRRGMRDDSPAPESGEQPTATNDTDGGAELPAVEPPAGDEVDPGADPAEVAAALEEACKAQKVAVRKITAERLPRGGGRVVITPKDGPKRVLDVSPDAWGEPPASIARGLVEAMGGE